MTKGKRLEALVLIIRSNLPDSRKQLPIDIVAALAVQLDEKVHFSTSEEYSYFDFSDDSCYNYDNSDEIE